MRTRSSTPLRRSERGASAVIVAICIAMLLGVGALAVDVGHLYVSRTELQGAADACALAGAARLYNTDGTVIDVGANQVGHDTGVANQSLKTAVEINWTAANAGDVQRGHWNFYAHDTLAARSFTPNDSTTVIDLWGVSDDELDADTNFINAVRCVTRREATPVTNFLAPVLGVFGGDFATSIVRADAVAIIGFAGTLQPGEVDLPIALCSEKLRNADGEYSCTIGRTLNDGNTEGTDETAMWTDFNQSEGCSAASANQVRPLICSGGNPGELFLGSNVDSTNGTTAATFDDLVGCWKTGLHLDTNDDDVPDADLDTDNDGWPDRSWELSLPVVACGNNDPCTPLVGAVTVRVVWMVRSANQVGQPNMFDEAPTKMDDWMCSSRTGGACSSSVAYPTAGDKRQCCWGEFVTAFNLKNSNDADAPYASKSVYFVPDCSPHELGGRSGGENFGVLAKYPALVR